MKNKDKFVIACCPENGDYYRSPDAIKGNKCMDCKQPVVVMPSSLEVAKEKKMKPGFICLECLLKKDISKSTIMLPTEKQIDEVRKEIIRNNPDIN